LAMDARATPPVRFTRAADGTSIAFMVWPGGGPPFLMLRTPASIPMAIHAKTPFVRESNRRFAANRSLVEFDWRGTGQSDRTLPTTLDDLVMDLAAITAVIDDEPDVVAPNASCIPAVSFASRNPSAWRSLLMLDPMVEFPRSHMGSLTRPGWEHDHVGLLLSLVRTFFPGATFQESETIAREWAETVPTESRQAHLSLLASVDLREGLRSLPIPTVILKAFPRSPAAEVATLVPDGVLVEVDFDQSLAGARARRHWDTHIGARFTNSPPTANHTSEISLSDREYEVLAALATGQSNGEIAAALTVSVRTVERHVRNIYSKIDVHNRAAATRWAIESGFG
jgi:DNA-binding CsgD family transcriptional regulator